MHLQIFIKSTIQEVDLQIKRKIPFYYLNDRPFWLFAQLYNIMTI